MNVSEGGSIELPCMRGVFPNPSNISWWWNEDQCQSLQCQVSEFNNVIAGMKFQHLVFFCLYSVICGYIYIVHVEIKLNY